MAKAQKVVLSERYASAIQEMNQRLWRRFPLVTDPADRDNIIGLTLARVADHEEKNGQAKNLPALIWRILPEVVGNLVRRGYYRIHSISMDHSVTTLRQGAVDPRAAIESQILADELLSVLDSRSRQVVYRRLIQGQSASEIAAVLKTSKGNVRLILHRAISQLRQVR